MKLVVNVLLVLFLFACKTQKEVVPTQVENPAPYWVKERPIISAYYIGIGSARINSGTEYQNTAKENALNDLSSEIKVQVSSNSLLHTLEQNSRFEQSYIETIQTKSNLDLEGFEMVDNWSDATHYYVYYRLDKAAYAEIQRQKKEKAQKQSLDFFDKGLAAAESGAYTNAVQYLLQGLQSIEAFWNEDNTVTAADGTSFMLDNALYANLNDLIGGVRIEMAQALERNFQNGFTPSGSILVTNNASGVSYSGVPLSYKYNTVDGKYRGRTTNGIADGSDITVSDTPENTAVVLELKIDTDELFEAFFKDPFMRDLLNEFSGAKTEIAVGYVPTKVWLQSSEENLGEELDPKPIENAVKTALSQRGVVFTSKKNEAQVFIDMEASTKEGGASQGFSSTFLQYEINVYDKSGRSIFNLSNSNVKGVDMEFKKAGSKAYRNLSRNLDSEIIRKLKNKIY